MDNRLRERVDPSNFLTNEELLIREIKSLKRKRGGKRSSITKRIKEINTLISSRGSRTKIAFLRNALREIFNEAEVIHINLMSLIDDTSPEFSDEWLETTRSDISTCFAEIEVYFEERQYDAPSQISFSGMNIEEDRFRDIQSWRETGGYEDSISTMSQEVLPKLMSHLNVNSQPSIVSKDANVSREVMNGDTKSIKSVNSLSKMQSHQNHQNLDEVERTMNDVIRQPSHFSLQNAYKVEPPIVSNDANGSREVIDGDTKSIKSVNSLSNMQSHQNHQNLDEVERTMNDVIRQPSHFSLQNTYKVEPAIVSNDANGSREVIDGDTKSVKSVNSLSNMQSHQNHQNIDELERTINDTARQPSHFNHQNLGEVERTMNDAIRQPSHFNHQNLGEVERPMNDATRQPSHFNHQNLGEVERTMNDVTRQPSHFSLQNLGEVERMMNDTARQPSHFNHQNLGEVERTMNDATRQPSHFNHQNLGEVERTMNDATRQPSHFNHQNLGEVERTMNDATRQPSHFNHQNTYKVDRTLINAFARQASHSYQRTSCDNDRTMIDAPAGQLHHLNSQNPSKEDRTLVYSSTRKLLHYNNLNPCEVDGNLPNASARRLSHSYHQNPCEENRPLSHAARQSSRLNHRNACEVDRGLINTSDQLPSYPSHPNRGELDRTLTDVSARQPRDLTSQNKYEINKTLFNRVARQPAHLSHPNYNTVDGWIDQLDNRGFDTHVDDGAAKDVAMRLLAQQNLPRVIMITFDGNPENWVDFITQFFEMVHSQHYLNDLQRKTYLIQHLRGEPLKAVQGFGNDRNGYVLSLKRLKYMFGNHSRVAQAVISKITKGKQIQNDDTFGLADLYYALSEVTNTLRRLGYHYDLESTDMLRQVLRRLPTRLLHKWAEYSFNIRKKEEPSMVHLEQWLQDRVMAAKDPLIPSIGRSSNNNRTLVGTTKANETCPLCNGDHRIHKCSQYTKMAAKDRLNFVKVKKLCFNCLQSHLVQNCKSRFRCFTPDCNAKHHTTLHDCLQRKGSEDKRDQQDTQGNTMVGVTAHSHRQVFLQVVPVIVTGSNGKTCKTYALLDDGSQATLIREDLVKHLKIRGTYRNLNLGTIKDDGEKLSVIACKFAINDLKGQFSVSIENAYSLPKEKFKVPGQLLPTNFGEGEEWEYVKNLGIVDVPAEKIQIVIGADVPTAQVTIQLQSGGKHKPCAVKTPFGWALMGALNDQSDSPETNIFSYHIRDEGEENFNRIVAKFWDTEELGTKFNFNSPTSSDDRNAISTLEERTKFVQGHYSVPMLWKDSLTLGSNYHIAKIRLEYLIKKFKRDPELFRMYKNNIKDYLQKGYAQVMTDKQLEATSKKSWYLPHHAVKNPNKPGKVRTVFDAAAKCRGVSLNDNLITGPDLLNNLIGVLLRFRKYKIAIVADVEAMFHQVHLLDEDKDAVRFLWKDDIFSNRPPDTLQMNVHIFGAKDSPTCASFALRKTATDNKSKWDAETIETILRNFYMDDLLKSCESERQGLTLSLNLIELLKSGGFKLTKFSSNSKEVLRNIPQSDLSVQTNEMQFDEEKTERTLGIRWRLSEDTFCFKTMTQSHDTTKETKRSILRKISSLFYPLGVLVPFIVLAKILLQDLWRNKYNWDEQVDGEYLQRWIAWYDDLNNIEKVKIPRSLYLDSLSEENVQLHIFCDASEKAFCAVGYLRTKKDNAVSVRFIMAKSRLAPVKRLTLPRLELQGAVLAVRLKEFVLKELDFGITTVNFWTDSMITIQYLRNKSKRLKIFVANRVAEIQES